MSKPGNYSLKIWVSEAYPVRDLRFYANLGGLFTTGTPKIALEDQEKGIRGSPVPARSPLLDPIGNGNGVSGGVLVTQE